MHTFTAKGFRIFHNGDFSGDAHIVDERNNPYKTLDVPCDVLFEFIAERVRAIRIADLEIASADEILLGRKETP